MQSEQLNELAAALAKAQGAMQNAAMNRINPHFKSRYADLASLIDAIRKPLADNGLCYLQPTIFNGAGGMVRTILMHTSGQWISAEWPLPATGTPQQMGSALTYARRYTLGSLVGISAEEDDDAEAAEKAKAKADAPNGDPVTVEQLGDIQMALVRHGIEIEWLLGFLGKRGLNITRLEDVPRSYHAKVLSAIKNKAEQTA